MKINKLHGIKSFFKLSFAQHLAQSEVLHALVIKINFAGKLQYSQSCYYRNWITFWPMNYLLTNQIWMINSADVYIMDEICKNGNHFVSVMAKVL